VPGLFRRQTRLPAGDRPPMDRAERVLAWARIADPAGAIVVTNRGLWLPGRGARLGWHEVHKAAWSGQELALTPAAVIEERDGYLVVADQMVQIVVLIEPGDVPDQVRTRVTRSVGYSLHHRFDGGGLRVVGRRVSGVDGLTWTVRYDPGTDSTAVRVRELTAELVTAARGATDPQW